MTMTVKFNPPQPPAKPRRFLVPRSRRLTCDVLHFHQQVPLCPHHRMIQLGTLDSLRKSTPQRISWPVLFLKAYGLLAREFPVLRQAWMPFPWPSIYEHDSSVGMLAIHREYKNEPWLFWGRFCAPENSSLMELQQLLNHYQTSPVERTFKRYLILSAMPSPLRRLLWWMNLKVSGNARSRRTGTFFLSTLSGSGAEIDMPPSFQTGVISYGPINAEGRSRLTLAYDHRLMDGRLVAQGLQRLEQILNDVLADELRAMLDSDARKSA